MSANPYSIMRQLVLFNEVEKARIEIAGYTVRHIIKIRDGFDANQVQSMIKKYIEKHRGVGSCHTVSFDWTDGPEIPERYRTLSPFELRLVEGCSGVAEDMEAALCQALSWISDVKIETLDAGYIGITVYPEAGKIISNSELEHCALLGELLASLPGIRVTVTVNTSEGILSNNDTPDPLKSQARKSGIRSDDIRKMFDSDEDFFRDIAKQNYLIDPQKAIPILKFEGSSILLPTNYEATNLKFLLPFYERIYLPIPFREKEPDLIFGASKQEILSLIQSGRIVPIIQQNYARYSEQTIREVTECGSYLSPRQLTVALATDFLTRNPLWLIAQKDLKMAKAILININNMISRYSGNNEEKKILRLLTQWLNYQTNAIADFDSTMLNQGALSALYLGPGALLAELILDEKRGPQRLDLEAWFCGMEIMHATALRSVCFPSMGGAIKLYEILASLYGYRQMNSLERLATAYELDRILEDIKIACPQNISVLDWAKAIEREEVKQLRRIINKAFRDCSKNDAPDLHVAAQRLSELAEQYTDLAAYGKKVVERLDIIGIFAEAVVSQNDLHSPIGWLAGVIAKNTVPVLWDQMSNYKLLAEAQDIIKSIGTLTNVNAVRLHRVRSKIVNGITKN